MWKDRSFFLEPENAATLGRFAAGVGLGLAFSAMVDPDLRLVFLHDVLWILAMVSAVAAAVFGEPFDGPTLNRWDEAAAYAALMLLVGYAVASGDAASVAGGVPTGAAGPAVYAAT